MKQYGDINNTPGEDYTLYVTNVGQGIDAGQGTVVAREGGQGTGATGTAGSSKPGQTMTLLHRSQLQWGDLKLHQNNGSTYISGTSDMYRQIQDSGNKKGPLGRVQSTLVPIIKILCLFVPLFSLPLCHWVLQKSSRTTKPVRFGEWAGAISLI